ncbi:hypothetical protein HQ545_07710 [Candidatus Woesearchaeota archaeon]|nr:hypothetical protein [Candidatus Woesearchaeota archaeon]
MIHKRYRKLDDLCNIELYPRGFVLKKEGHDLIAQPHRDKYGRVFTLKSFIPSDPVEGVINSLKEIISGFKFTNQKTEVLPQIVYDWDDLDVKVWRKHFTYHIEAPEALYSDRLLVLTQLFNEVPIFGQENVPIYCCSVQKMDKGVIGKRKVVMYAGRVDRSLRQDANRVDVVDRLVELVREHSKKNYEVITEGFTRKEKYVLGLDSIRLVS